MHKTNRAKWAAMVRKCRGGPRTLDELHEETGLSVSTISKWEQKKSVPFKSSVDTLIAASPHINPAAVYVAAGLDIPSSFNEDLEDELKLGKLFYEKLINKGLEEYEKSISNDNYQLYGDALDLVLDLIVKAKK